MVIIICFFSIGLSLAAWLPPSTRRKIERFYYECSSNFE
jgi:hypothetical protein